MHIIDTAQHSTHVPTTATVDSSIEKIVFEMRNQASILLGSVFFYVFNRDIHTRAYGTKNEIDSFGGHIRKSMLVFFPTR